MRAIKLIFPVLIAILSFSAEALEKNQLQKGAIYFISYYWLNVRGTQSTQERNITGILNQNDQVLVTDPLPSSTPLVKVRVLSSSGTTFNSNADYYVSKDYLSPSPVNIEAGKYFVIQNIATEKTRVYERCTTSPGCAHRLIFETDMVVGRNEEGTKENRYAYMTWLGHAKLSEWIKFYSDGQQTYPSWYTTNQDMKTIPAPITDSPTNLIGSRKWIVKGTDGKDTIYGAFGWYAGKLIPADEKEGVNYQWMHGTIGWGKDGAASIDVTRGILINIFSNPGSHGCTRLENRAIAFMRSFLAPGTDIYRIYARESTREKEEVKGFFKKKITPLPRYAATYNNPAKWNYILLTDGAQQANGLTADARVITGRAIQVTPGVNLLDEGVFEVDQYPNVAALDYRYTPSTGKSGDRYRIDSGKKEEADKTQFRGYFLVDEGRFVDYHHPDETAVKGKVHVSGLLDFKDSVPAWLATSGAHNPPEALYPQDPNDRNHGGG